MTKRQIKFRAWEIKTNELFYNLAFYNDNFTAVMSNERPLLSVIPTQFIGIADNNNKDIYEGDVIKFKYNSWDEDGDNQYIDEVVYDEDLTAFVFKSFSSKPVGFLYDELEIFELEIIGNIFENPELIKRYEQTNKI